MSAPSWKILSRALEIDVFPGSSLVQLHFLSWIYENSNEYLKSLQLLIHGISKFQNVELIIRVREEPVECDMKALQELLPKVNNWQFSKELKFENDLHKSDLLISFSSKAIPRQRVILCLAFEFACILCGFGGCVMSSIYVVSCRAFARVVCSL